MTRITGAPIEISIKLPNKKTIKFNCGKTELTEEKEWKKGWCATKLDNYGMLNYVYVLIKKKYNVLRRAKLMCKKNKIISFTKRIPAGKIERWGFCRPECAARRYLGFGRLSTDRRKDSFMFVNVNLLTDTECVMLFSQVSPLVSLQFESKVLPEY